MSEFGPLVLTPEINVLWLLEHLWRRDDAMKPPAEQRKGYEQDFRMIWRQRFAHLHPDGIEAAVSAEWAQMRFNDQSGMYERIEPVIWCECPVESWRFE